MRSRFERRITPAEFRDRVAPLVGLPVTRPWRGYGSALFLELGPLHEERPIPTRPPSEADG